MENTSISRNQRRLIFLAATITFFALILVGQIVQDDLGGTYDVEASPIDNPYNIISGTAEISYNKDNGNFYFETITLETGEIIYLYDEASPVNFEDSNEIHDDNEQYWNVSVHEQIDKPTTAEQIKITVLNILYWSLIVILFLIRSFIKDIVGILKISKENPEEFNKLDSSLYSLGCKVERWRNNTKHFRLIENTCKIISLLLAIIWFLVQYNII